MCFIGIVDADKRQPSYVEACAVIARTEHIALLKHGKDNHYFLRISQLWIPLYYPAQKKQTSN